MKNPVLIYISIMVIMSSLSIRVSWLVFVGAISFIVSDIELALNKFHKPIPHKSIINSIFYFPAQFIFALSIFLLINQETDQNVKNDLQTPYFLFFNRWLKLSKYLISTLADILNQYESISYFSYLWDAFPDNIHDCMDYWRIYNR